MKNNKAKLLGRSGMTPSQAAAACVTHGFPIASLVKETLGSEKLEHMDMLEELDMTSKKVISGDMSYIEAALVRQFTVLEALFAELGVRGMRCRDIREKAVYMKLALRAQAQARTTAEALGGLKNPPVLFARQANVATGPQQINNTVTFARVEGNENARSELLPGARHDDEVDTRTQSQAGIGHPELEAVVLQYGPENPAGKGALEPKRLERRTARADACPGEKRK